MITTAELVTIADPETKEEKIYLRFDEKEENGKPKERFVQINKDEFDALVKLFVDKIISKAKEKNDKVKKGVKKVVGKGKGDI